eukprot:6316276-Heterocapsa_arctica.AAC.1
MHPTQPVSNIAKPRQSGNSRYAPRARYQTLYGVGRIVCVAKSTWTMQQHMQGSRSKFALYRLPNC